jgi:polysaccharide export outer membrane protein
VGEVKSPGTYVVADERLTLLEGLALGGYLTDFANRSNILIIRENNGQRQFGYLDLRSRDIFNSPFFYLQQNDQIYVEPDKYKATVIRDPVTRIFPYVSLVTSIATLILALSR